MSNWKIDNSHSLIDFSVKHMMISTVRGRFEKFSGNVHFDEQDPEKSSVEVQIDAASISTNEPNRDNHLKSPDFLDVANYPYITFKSTRIERTDDTHGKITGDLTIHGVSRPVTLDVEYAGMAKSPWGTTSAGFSATAKIYRKEWGLNWNKALETGGWLVGDELKVNIELEIVRQEQPESEAAQK